MAIMPGVQWRPLPRPSSTRMSAHDVVVIHTMVGSLEGTDGYFRRLTNGVNSHFGTGGDGTIRQWVDTTVRSGANGDGNYRCISIENADMGPQFPAWNTNDGGAVPPFTPAQIEANARICAWANTTHGIPLALIPDSKPGRRGIGFHRLGVPGYVVAGGERWSSAAGKVCPAVRRIAQIPQIIDRARQIVGSAPIAQEEDEMTPEQAAQLARIHFELTNRFPSRVAGSKATETAIGYVLNTDRATAVTEQRINVLEAKLDKLIAALGQADDPQ